MVLVFQIVLCMTAAGSLVAAGLALVSRLADPALLYRARLAALAFLLIPFCLLPLRLPESSPAFVQTGPILPAAPVRQEAASPETPAPTAAGRFPGWELAAGIWLSGALLTLAASLFGRLWFTRRLCSGARVCTDGERLRLLGEAAAELGIRRCPPLLLSGEAASPMLTGLLRPRLLLPEGETDARGLRLVLTHELVHYRRGDLWVKLCAELARCIHWFNPLVWLLERQLGEGCELSCDARTVAGLSGDERMEYGRAILDALDRSAVRGRGLCFGGTKRHFERRLYHMLHTGKRPVKAALAVVCLVAVLGAAGFGICYAAAPELPRSSSGSAAAGEVEPNAAAIRDITGSVRYDTEQEILSFRIPDALPEGTLLYLQATGRVKMGADDSSGMSIHLFEQETASYGWKPGWTYAATLEREELMDCTVAAAILDAQTERELAAASASFGPDGKVERTAPAGEFPPLPQSGEGTAQPGRDTVLSVALGELAAGEERAYGPYEMAEGDSWTTFLSWEGKAQLAVCSSRVVPGEGPASGNFITAPDGSLALKEPFAVKTKGLYWFRVLNLSEADASDIRGEIHMDFQ